MDDNPLGDLISEKVAHTGKTTYATEFANYEIRSSERRVQGDYFVIYVQACPGGWEVLAVEDGPAFTNVDLMRAWGEGVGF